MFGGYYLFGEGQLGMAHPWHLLLYRFLPLTPAFNIEIVSSYVFTRPYHGWNVQVQAGRGYYGASLSRAW